MVFLGKILEKLRLSHLFWLFLALLWAFFYGLGAYGFLNNNEGLYAEIPREMLVSHHYTLPYLNGVPYLEKPPLLYWLITVAYKLFGVQEWSARLIPALAGLGTCWILYFFTAFHVNRSVALKAAWILGTSSGYIVFSRMVFFDGLLTFFLTGALFSFFHWFQTQNKLFLRVFYICLALGILTKGFVMLILAGLVLGAWLLYLRPGRGVFKRCFDIWGIVLFLGISVPWHVLASQEDSGFAWFYFVNEHILRFLGRREPRDYYHGPLYYYIPRLLLYFLPWTLLFWTFFVKRSASLLKDRPFTAFLLSWFGMVFIFFSFSQAKANYYLVTVMPPLALLLALRVQDFENKLYRFLVPGLGLFTLLVATAAIWAARHYEDRFSAKNIAALVPSTAQVYLYRDYEKLSSVVFYLKRLVPLINSLSNDLKYGETSGKRPDLFLKSDQFQQMLGKTSSPVFCFVYKEQVSSFEQTYPSFKKVEERGPIHLYAGPF